MNEGDFGLLVCLVRSLSVPPVPLLQVPTSRVGCHGGGTSSGPWSQLMVHVRMGYPHGGRVFGVFPVVVAA